ncbi:FtsK/SpoIIIE domain-containing protein [Puerhibacterium sp. TATVAM-FAB25]|uniref:FtsK/SpoIIIE domain-containing protein n=1 Tax=Puerhibacterium sp. TATVAM-FAB25 TaxID=3093699 RepID=UPI00397E3A2E
MTPPPAAAAGVRVTVHPGEDVLLPAGARLGEVRGELADLLRRPELRHVPLAVDGVAVDDGVVAGERPLLPGATLAAVGPGPAVPPGPGSPGPVTPVGAAWVLARVAGREAGELAALAAGGRVRLPGGVEVRAGARGHVAVRVRRGDDGRPRPWARRGPGLPARGRPDARRSVPALSRATPAGGLRRVRLGRLPRRWRPGDVLTGPGPDGTGVAYAVRPGGDAGALLASSSADDRGPTAAGSPGSTFLAALLPVAGALALAAVLRQPVLALFSLVGLLAVLPQLLAARRARRSGAPEPRPAVRVGAAVPFGWDAPAGAAAAPGADPAGLALAVLAAHRASDAAWAAALRARGPGPAPTGVAGPGAAWPAGPAPGPPAPRPLLADGALAVRGPREAALAVARAVVADLAARGAAVAVRGVGRPAWSWCGWLPDAGPRLLVVDAGPGPVAAPDGAAAQGVVRSGGAVVLLLPPGATVPAWCRGVLDVVPADATGVAPAGRATAAGAAEPAGHGEAGTRVRRTAADGTVTAEPLVGVSAVWAERLARRLAGLRALARPVAALRAGAPAGSCTPDGTPDGGTEPADPRLPAVVPLAPLLGPPTGPTGGPAGERIAVAWAAAASWAAPLGVDAAGRTVRFDLVGDGPHLLVAGTTGSGKSELLQSLVLGLALGRSPQDLALVLVDFKGGASFGACARLPHVVGQVTDLDAGLAGRALAGLRAELRTREHLLARHGVADVAALPAGTLPRLVVVLDEFRALADDVPELLPGLLRVAAQGRSLGVHLVLATQRPAGAVSADVRANVSARLALRVVDAADSHDVLDVPTAARIPVTAPGRAVLRVGPAPPVVLQCAQASAAAGARPPVRRAPGWASTGVADGPADGGPGTGGRPDAGPGAEAGARTVGGTPLDRLVAEARAAAARLGCAAGSAPWLPPLPTVARAADLAAAGDAPHDGAAAPEATSGAALPLALGDLPDAQRRTAVRWDPAAGHLAVVGRARSGRTTAALTLARAALDRGWHVHALVPPSARDRFAPLTAHPGFGTLAGPDDPRRAGRLLRALATTRPGTPTAPTLVVVDDVEGLRAAVATAVRDPLAAALAAGGAAFTVTAETPSVAGLAPRVGPRLVLLSGDAHADVLLGAPSSLAGRGRAPGRGVWLAAGDPVECQVLLPDPADARGAAPAAGRTRTAAGTAPLRVLPLPDLVQLDDLPRSDAPARLDVLPRSDDLPRSGGVPVGVGGDAAAPLGLRLAAGALVAGTRGSGRTTTLRVLARGLARQGRPVAVLARDAALRAEAHAAPASAPTPDGVRAVLAHLGRAEPPLGGAADRRPVLVVDDADTLAQALPAEVERLAQLAAEGGAVVVAACTTTAALLAHRGLLAHLRAGRTGVLLDPGERGADEVLASPLEDVVEPGVRQAGRGALVVDGAATPLQVARP